MKSEIPNIKGTLGNIIRQADSYDGGGLKWRSVWASGNQGNNLQGAQLEFNATWSCNRYGTYTEVNPLYESCKFAICY